MKTALTHLFLFALICNVAIAQKNQAKLRASNPIVIDPDLVTVFYDIANTTEINTDYQVILDIKGLKPGQTVDALEWVSGDGVNSAVNNTNSKGRSIRWYYTKDGYTQAEAENMKFEIKAFLPKSTQKEIPWKIAGSIAGAGLTVLIVGLSQESSAQDDYDTYKAVTDPNNAVYSEFSGSGSTSARGEFYNDLNKRHKGAQVLMSLGGVAIAAAGTLIITSLINKKKGIADSRKSMYEKYASSNIQLYNVSSIESNLLNRQPQIGMGLRIKF